MKNKNKYKKQKINEFTENGGERVDRLASGLHLGFEFVLSVRRLAEGFGRTHECTAKRALKGRAPNAA
jgi:hypothetical protein